MNCKQLDQAHFMGVFGTRQATLTHGEGCVVWDEDGKSYLDFVAGIAVNALGHAHPAWVEALAKQAATLGHVSNLYYTPVQAKLAADLTAATGCSKVFFGNSGAEANEGAIKLARRWGALNKPAATDIISLDGSFHGRTLGTLSATGQPKYQMPFQPLVPGFVQIPAGDVAALCNAAPNAYALLIEPIQGENGVIAFPFDYWQTVTAICAEHNLLLIADEIQTGMGRTGSLLHCTQIGITPDIITLAKGLGGGVPIGAVLCNEKADVFAPGEHGSTFGGNALCCAAAQAVLDIVNQPAFLAEVTQKGERLLAGLTTLHTANPDKILAPRGAGLMLGLPLAEGVDGKAIVAAMFDKGFLINCAGHNTLRFVPPLIVSNDQIDALLAALKEVL